MIKSMKKITIIIMIFASFLVGCQSGDQTGNEAVITGTSKEVLESIIKESGQDFGMTFDEPVNKDNCQSVAGLTIEQFEEYVEDAFTSKAAITTQAHLATVIKCKDEKSADKVNELVKKGFDSGRLICVFPEQSFVINSDSYVILISSTMENIAPLKKGIEAVSGNKALTYDVFYENIRE